MLSRLACITPLIACAALSAQTVYTTPPGSFHLAGGALSAIMFGSAGSYQSRTQQGDANLIGTSVLPLIGKIAWRRSVTSNATSTPRTADLLLVMAHTDFANFSLTFASNYKDTPVTVFTLKTVNLPDWTAVPNPAPAAFDLIVPFDTPWVYNRVDALVWDLGVSNTGAGGSYYQDWFSGPATADYSITTNDVAGCTTPNGAFAKLDIYHTDPTNLLFGFDIKRGPSNAAVVVLLGGSLASLPVPGLCAPLGINYLADFAIGTTDASGALAASFTSVPWNPAFSGVQIAAQAAAADASQTGLKIAMSNSTLTLLPKVAGAPALNIKRTYSTASSTATTGITPTITAVATEFIF